MNLSQVSNPPKNGFNWAPAEILKHWIQFEVEVNIFNYLNLRPKELCLWNKIKYLNLNILRTRCCKPLIFQTQIIWCNRIHSLKYLRSATFGPKDIVIRNSEFVAKTQFLSFEKYVSNHLIRLLNNFYFIFCCCYLIMACTMGTWLEITMTVDPCKECVSQR